MCRSHGGAAPQVKRAARERLNDLIDPAINELGRRLEDPDNPALSLRAATDVLDRTGYKPTDHVEHSGELRTVTRIVHEHRAKP